MRFAVYDPGVPPHMVTGWYDLDELDYSNSALPPESMRLKLTDAQWDARMQGQWAVNNGALVPWEPPPAAEQPFDVPKLVVVDRLQQLGLLRQARTALKLGLPDDQLSDAELLLRTQWEEAQAIGNTNQAVREFLVALGGPDLVDAVLAPVPS
jgi:hypothetical protein